MAFVNLIALTEGCIAPKLINLIFQNPVVLEDFSVLKIQRSLDEAVWKRNNRSI